MLFPHHLIYIRVKVIQGHSREEGYARGGVPLSALVLPVGEGGPLSKNPTGAPYPWPGPGWGTAPPARTRTGVVPPPLVERTRDQRPGTPPLTKKGLGTSGLGYHFPCGQTHACENSTCTFSILRMRVVNIFNYIIYYLLRINYDPPRVKV